MLRHGFRTRNADFTFESLQSSRVFDHFPLVIAGERNATPRTAEPAVILLQPRDARECLWISGLRPRPLEGNCLLPL